jgi:hypothetical protein
MRRWDHRHGILSNGFPASLRSEARCAGDGQFGLSECKQACQSWKRSRLCRRRSRMRASMSLILLDQRNACAVVPTSGQCRDADIAIVYYAGTDRNRRYNCRSQLTPFLNVTSTHLTRQSARSHFDGHWAAKQLRLIIPVAGIIHSTRRSARSGRALWVEDSQGRAEQSEHVIAFAAKASSPTYGGDNQSSPFTAALVKYFTRPGPRSAQGVRLCPQRRSEGYQQQARAVHLWLAWRRRRSIGSGHS